MTCDEEDWTDFFDIDDPTGADGCDCEDLPTLIQQQPQVCPNPTAMEVKLKNGDAISTLNENVYLSLIEGFKCYNHQQDDNTCADYKVRYCCPTGNFYFYLLLLNFFT